MATIDLSTITIPTPTPYARPDVGKAQDDFYFCLLQILAIAKANGFLITDAPFAPPGQPTISCSESMYAVQNTNIDAQNTLIEQLALKLPYNTQFQAMLDENVILAALPRSDSNYAARAAALNSHYTFLQMIVFSEDLKNLLYNEIVVAINNNQIRIGPKTLAIQS